MVALQPARNWFAGYLDAWDRFWFEPRLPHVLCALRVAAGVMLLYSHLVLATDLTSFLGDSAWINNQTARQLHDGTFGFNDWGRSYLWSIDSPFWLWIHHGVTIAVTASFAIGLLTRLTGPLAWFLQLMYLHRLTGALFGLDQIVTYTVMYLMLSPCGSCFSVDSALRRRLGARCRDSKLLAWLFPDARPSVAANVATRLLQLHLCVIYLFGGLSKARGQTWWDGTAMWLSVGSYEYQSIDMTWMANYPRFFTAITHLTLFWEVFYCALIWPRRTRPLMLAGAVLLHGGIALFLGMITFGTMMIAANMIFVSPQWFARVLDRQKREDWLDVPEQESSQRTASASRESDSTTVDRWSELERREERLRVASRRLRAKSSKLKQRESKYQERVRRLKEREGKIKRLIERRREAKTRDAESEGQE